MQYTGTDIAIPGRQHNADENQFEESNHSSKISFNSATQSRKTLSL